MNIDELKLSIRIAHIARVSLFISGVQGLGKSAAPKAYCSNNFHFKDGKVPYGYIDLRCASMEASELRGLPEKDLINKTVTYLPPDELPRGEWISNEGVITGEYGSEKPKDDKEKGIYWTQHKGILVLEEINRAEDDIHQALFQLVYDFQIGKWHLPTGWSIVATGNPSTSGFIVNQFMHENAFKDRFIHVTVDIDEDYIKGWIAYMQNLGHSEQVINKITQFCSLDTEYLSRSSKDEEDIEVMPSPRSWEMVSKVEMACMELSPIYDGEDSVFEKVRNLMISGIVSSDVTAAYNECVVRVTPKQIANDFHNVKGIIASLERNQLQALSWGVSGYADKIKDMKDEVADNFIAFGKWILTESSKRDDDSRDLAVGYFDSLIKNEQNEDIRSLSFTNTSLQKLLKRTDNDTYLWSKIEGDPELNELVHLAHRGNLK